MLFSNLLTLSKALKVEWFRFSAKTTRWKEEVNILIEEIKRTQRFFLHYHYKWKNISRRCEGSSVENGMASFAARCVNENLSYYVLTREILGKRLFMRIYYMKHAKIFKKLVC